MGKRVFLFLLTNLAIVVTMSLVLSLLGFGGYLGPDGQLYIGPLAVFCFVWGMGGAFISLAISRWVAKRAVGAQLIDGRTGREDLDWLHSTVAALRRLMANEGRVDPTAPALAAFKISGARRRSWLTAFSTHPPLAERIAALESAAGMASFGPR